MLTFCKATDACFFMNHAGIYVPPPLAIRSKKKLNVCQPDIL